MSRRPPPGPSSAPPPPSSAAARVARLAAAAKAWERDVVIPHCAVCTRPCCALTDVVLELSAPEAETLYRITPASKQLPATVQASGGKYYAHGAPCPAFAVSTHRCTIYDTGRKPVACADFPVYADDDVVTADRRCEAVAAGLEALEDALVAALEPGETLAVLADPAFADFVSFAIEAPTMAASPPAAAPTARSKSKPPPPKVAKKRQPQGKPEPGERPPRDRRDTTTGPARDRPPPPWRQAPASAPTTTPGRRR